MEASDEHIAETIAHCDRPMQFKLEVIKTVRNIKIAKTINSEAHLMCKCPKKFVEIFCFIRQFFPGLEFEEGNAPLYLIRWKS